MSFKTIVVNLNHEARAEAMVAAAAHLARKTEAHVAGLYVMPPLFMPSDVVLPMGADFYEQQIAEHKAQAARVKAVFDNLTQGEPFVTEWRVAGEVRSAYEAVADGVIVASRAAELLIVSQANDGEAPPMLTDIPQRAALESGRPVLVVPTAWDARKFGDTIAVAWNNSREAARAVFDALPLMLTAKKVRLISAGDTGSGESAAALPGADIAATLARHGINVEATTISDGGRHAGIALLEQCATDGTDLLVMGAYGHSRMREFILGGVTRHVLKTMTLPVLMSH